MSEWIDERSHCEADRVSRSNLKNGNNDSYCLRLPRFARNDTILGINEFKVF